MNKEDFEGIYQCVITDEDVLAYKRNKHDTLTEENFTLAATDTITSDTQQELENSADDKQILLDTGFTLHENGCRTMFFNSDKKPIGSYKSYIIKDRTIFNFDNPYTKSSLASWFNRNKTDIKYVGFLCGDFAGTRIWQLDADSEESVAWVNDQIKNNIIPDTPLMIKTTHGIRWLYKIPNGQTIDMHNIGWRTKLDILGIDKPVICPTFAYDANSSYQWDYDRDKYTTLFDVLRNLPELDPYSVPPENQARAQIVKASTVKIPEGERNEYFFKRACGLIDRVGTETVRATIHTENINLCDPPLCVNEVDKLLDNVIKSYSRQSSPKATTATPSFNFNSINFEEDSMDTTQLLQSEDIHIEYLVDGLMPKNEVMLLTGSPKAGKSMLTLSMAYQLSLTLENNLLFNKFLITKPCKTIFLQKENQLSSIKDRIALMESDLLYSQYHDSTKVKNYCGRTQSVIYDGVLNDQKFIEFVESLIDYERPDIVVIDPLSMFHNLKENDNDEMTGLFLKIQKLARTKQVNIIIVHHKGKAFDNKSRGASAILACVDSIVSLHSGKNYYTLEFEMRNCQKINSIRLSCSENLIYQYIGDHTKRQYKNANSNTSPSLTPAKDEYNYDVFLERINEQLSITSGLGITALAKRIDGKEKHKYPAIKKAAELGDIDEREGKYYLQNMLI